MGTDLSLLPVDHETRDGVWVCLQVFHLDLNRVITPFLGITRHRVEAPVFWPLEDVPEEFLERQPEWPWAGGPQHHSMFGYATGRDLQYVLVQDIWAALADAELDLAEINWFERAALAYLNALPEGTKVLYYWW